MAHACRVFGVLLFAVALAQGSVTIRWNTRAPAAAAQSARVIAVAGTRVLLRLPDGSTREYTTTPAQAGALRDRIGTVIQYRVH